MKKFICVLLIAIQVLVSIQVFAYDWQPTDYDSYYSQFVDTKEPLSDLMNKDLSETDISYTKYPILSEIPNENREDYFDVAYGDDPMQKLDIYHPKGKKNSPVVFYIHGGGWTFGDKTEPRFVGPTLLSLGYTIVSINYRFSQQAPHPAQIEDCAKALKWTMDNISKYGGDPNNIAITGHSAGGHLTALLVTDKEWHKKYNIDMRKVKCWIPISGIYDFNLPETWYHSWMYGFNSGLLDDPDKINDASPVTHITGKEPPCLIIHGADDWLVPKTNATEMYDKLKKKGAKAELGMIKGYWHCTTIIRFGTDDDKVTKLYKKFLAKYMPTCKNHK